MRDKGKDKAARTGDKSASNEGETDKSEEEETEGRETEVSQPGRRASPDGLVTASFLSCCPQLSSWPWPH